MKEYKDIKDYIYDEFKDSKYRYITDNYYKMIFGESIILERERKNKRDLRQKKLDRIFKDI